MDDLGRSTPSTHPILYVLDTNVLIHDPNALLNFEEHHVAIPMTVLEELDKLKSGKHSVAAECRQAIRLIDMTLGEASPADVFLTENSPSIDVVDKAGLLAPLDGATLEQVGEQYRPSSGTWTEYLIPSRTTSTWCSSPGRAA